MSRIARLPFTITPKELRKSLGITQSEIPGFSQVAVSNFEKRCENGDVKASTLAHYLESMGLEVEINSIDKNGGKFNLYQTP